MNKLFSLYVLISKTNSANLVHIRSGFLIDSHSHCGNYLRQAFFVLTSPDTTHSHNNTEIVATNNSTKQTHNPAYTYNFSPAQLCPLLHPETRKIRHTTSFSTQDLTLTAISVYHQPKPTTLDSALSQSKPADSTLQSVKKARFKPETKIFS